MGTRKQVKFFMSNTLDSLEKDVNDFLRKLSSVTDIQIEVSSDTAAHYVAMVTYTIAVPS
jgi:hypothetical protein